MTWIWGYGHPALCSGCEACAPMSPEEKERLRREAAERVRIKRALRLMLRALEDRGDA